MFDESPIIDYGFGRRDDDYDGLLNAGNLGFGQSGLAFDISEIIEQQTTTLKPVSTHLSFNKPRKGVFSKLENAKNLERVAQSLTVQYFYLFNIFLVNQKYFHSKFLLTYSDNFDSFCK